MCDNEITNFQGLQSLSQLTCLLLNNNRFTTVPIGIALSKERWRVEVKILKQKYFRLLRKRYLLPADER